MSVLVEVGWREHEEERWNVRWEEIKRVGQFPDQLLGERGRDPCRQRKVVNWDHMVLRLRMRR